MKTQNKESEEMTSALWNVNYYEKEKEKMRVELKKAELYLEYLKQNEQKNPNS